MKYFIKICAFIIALAVLGSVTVCAADSYFTLNGFTFSINNNGEAVIYKYEGTKTDITIPNTLLGSAVTEIGDYAFLNNTAISSVSFEQAASLKKIGVSAFCGCTNLKEIDLPASISEISFGAFQDCSELEKVSFKSGVTAVPAQCFYKCAKLNSVELSQTVHTLSDRCFALCDSLEYLEIPDSVTSIADNAFENTAVEIYCGKDSYAQKFAQEKGVSYEYAYDYELGDANLDGEINVNDVTAIQTHIAGIDSLRRYKGSTFADLNKDDKITIDDATYLQYKLAGHYYL